MNETRLPDMGFRNAYYTIKNDWRGCIPRKMIYGISEKALSAFK